MGYCSQTDLFPEVREFRPMPFSMSWGCTFLFSIWGLVIGWWPNFESSLSLAAINELLLQLHSATQASLAVAASSQNSLHKFASHAKCYPSSHLDGVASAYNESSHILLNCAVSLDAFTPLWKYHLSTCARCLGIVHMCIVPYTMNHQQSDASIDDWYVAQADFLITSHVD